MLLSPTGLAPADVLLADGSIAVVRALRPDDGPALHELHEGVSDEAIRLRFFSVARHAAHTYVDHVLGDPETLALVAVHKGRLVGFATAEPMNGHCSEIAFLVADDVRRLGVGTLLLEHLAAVALARGITEFEADVLSENHAMLSVFAHAGFSLSRTPDLGTVVLTFGTTSTDEATDRADTREFQAESRSLVPLLRPGSVAVVGIRSDGTGVGATVLRSITAGGFRGTVAAVHPRANSLLGVDAYPSVVAGAWPGGPGRGLRPGHRA